ncbi:MAG: O-methyltransferase [Actinomycetota bacterium]|nr:O-methyltransferase [Actinomycetota bacterium]
MDIVAPEIERYMATLAAGDDEPVLLEMEALADSEGFPIIGRLCGRTLEVLARAIGARRIFEMGSGFGYSAYWFARATGADGEIHLTDTDAGNETKALDFLSRAGLDGPISYHVAPALDAFDKVAGEFDIVYCDIDKDGYPEAWKRARTRVRVGGFFMCDNVLWSGRVVQGAEGDAWTEAIQELNELIATDPDYRSTIVPTRDGVVVALRVS